MLGKFTRVKDEIGHLVFAIPIPAFLVMTGRIDQGNALILVTSSFLIDFDHVLNPLIKRLFRLQGKATIIPNKNSTKGYAIKFFHGVDWYLVYASYLFLLIGNFFYAFGLFLNLTMHHIWDFLVYNHEWKEFFFLARLKSRFQSNERKRLKDFVFTPGTVPH